MSKIYTPSAFPKKVKKDNYEKGQLFEEYIINLFNKEFFYRLKWRKSQKFDNLHYTDDAQYPDLEWELVFRGKGSYKFAVECKWRKDFINEKVPWAKDRQISSYKKFQAYRGIPVFVVIGIGGEPNNPEKLFVTPLDSICMKKCLSKLDLYEIERHPRRRFYYDYRQLTLL